MSSNPFRKINLRIASFLTRYRSAEAQITTLVARAVLAGQLGDPVVRRSVRRAVRAILTDLDLHGIPDAQRLVRDSYAAGVRIGNKAGPPARITDEALTLLLDNVAGNLHQATDHVGRRVDDVFRKEGLRAAALSLVSNEPVDVPNTLAKSLAKQGVTSFVDKSGRRWGLETYSEMAVKTITSEAVFHGTEATLLGSGVDLVDVNSVANPCPQCQPYDGKTFSLTGRTAGYEKLNTTFPIHPNCQHYIREHQQQRRAA